MVLYEACYLYLVLLRLAFALNNLSWVHTKDYIKNQLNQSGINQLGIPSNY